MVIFDKCQTIEDDTMCLEVFVGVDIPLPDYDNGLPLFRVMPLQEENEIVRQHFSKPYIYDLLSVEGCACGFQYSPDDLDILSYIDVPIEVKTETQIDYNARRESVCHLQEYLRLALQASSVEVYSCWIGDEMDKPTSYQEVTLTHFGGDSFNFIQKQMLTVT